MQSGFSRAKLDIFRQSGLIWENEVYSGKSCCIRAKCLYSGKNCCIRAVVILLTLAPLLASDWLILALLTSSKWITSQRRATTWGHLVGCLFAPSSADDVRAGVCDWRTGV